MKSKVPKTKPEVELICNNLLLLQENKKLKAHLQAALATLDFVLNDQGKQTANTDFSLRSK